MNIKTISIIFCLVSILMISCNKTNVDNKTDSKIQQTVKVSVSSQKAAPKTGITLSSYGFLIFNTEATYDSYLEFLTTNTHATIQNYLSLKGFISKGSTMYIANADTVTEAQQSNYVFGAYGIVQIEGVVLAPTADSKFVLALLAKSLNTTTYTAMINHTFIKSTMDKFSTFRNIQLSSLLVPYIQSNPLGYQETTQYNQGTEPTMKRRRTSVDVNGGDFYNAVGQCIHYVNHYDVVDTYFLGIHIGHKETFTGQTQTAGTNC